MATEIAILPLHSNRTPDDATSEGGQAWKDTLETLAEQEGMQRTYWGREAENPDILRLFVDWDSVDAHIAFTKKDVYKPFIERAGFLCDMKNAKLFHTHFTPHPATSALSDTSAGATEIISVYFPADYSDSDKDKFVEDFKKLVKAIEDNATTYHGSAGGWVVEKLKIPDTEEEGTVYASVIGWDSVEAHMAFRETQAFKDNIHYLRGAKDLKKLTVTHASLKETSAAGGVGDISEEVANEEGAGALNPQAGGRQSVKTAADGTTTKNDGGAANSNKKERAGR